MNRLVSNQDGFTMIELILAIVIIAILAGVAMQKLGNISESSRFETTTAEMDMLTRAIVGNPTLENNGHRSDYGYVGDIGALPLDLDALMSNPGGYSTWNGPYIKNSFEQYTDDFKKDAWGTTYTYSGGLTLQSTGGSGNIVRKLANSVDDLLYNSVSGNIYDFNGTPPGVDFSDSISVRLTFPDGAGGIGSSTITPDLGGYFSFDSIPIGSQTLSVIYLPGNDTIIGYPAVNPGGEVYDVIKLSQDYW